MKRRIGQIYNKPIVIGDKNLVTKNEVHESTLKGGSADANKKYGYYLINKNYLTTIVGYNIEDVYSFLMMEIFRFFNKVEINGGVSFAPYSGPTFVYKSDFLFYYMAIMNDEVNHSFDSSGKLGIKVDETDTKYTIVGGSIKKEKVLSGSLFERLENEEVSENGIKELFIPITKEEYENLSN